MEHSHPTPDTTILGLRPSARVLFAAAAVLGLTTAAVPVAAQPISGASASTAGSTGNGGDSDGSIRSSVAIQINDGTTLKLIVDSTF